MQRTPVVSSTISSVGYDLQLMVLEVQFHSGGVYQYFGVPQPVYRGLMIAGSKGGYLDTFVKKAGYAHQRIG
jgi:hypothetical protein